MPNRQQKREEPTLRQDQVANGVRVRIVRTIEIFPIDIFPVGLTGTMVDVDHTAQVIAHVQLDDRRACLNVWDNRLQVHVNADEGADCTLDAFEVIVP